MTGIEHAAFTPQLGETVAEAVRRQILDAVLFGDLAAPSRLFPAELALRFGVSITPVREALAHLASEGFIEAIPRHGYHVRTPTPDHVGELWAVRLALELMAAESVVRRFPDAAARHAALAPLRAVHAKLEDGDALSHREHVALNGQFHDTIMQLAGNALLAGTYRGIRVRLFVAWVQRGSPAWRGRLGSEQGEHQAVLDALEAGDIPALDAAIRRHLARSLGDALRDAANDKTSNQTEETHEKTRSLDPGGGAGAAPGPAGPRPGADDDPDVDLPQPRRHQPARGRAG